MLKRGTGLENWDLKCRSGHVKLMNCALYVAVHLFIIDRVCFSFSNFIIMIMIIIMIIIMIMIMIIIMVFIIM